MLHLAFALCLCVDFSKLIPVAQSEAVMSGPMIREVLTGATVVTPRAGKTTIRQVFYSDRRTRYDDGRESWGLWEVRGDLYCSQWPPSPSWVCYEMRQWTEDGAHWVVWIGDSGTRYEGFVER